MPIEEKVELNKTEWEILEFFKAFLGGNPGVADMDAFKAALEALNNSHTLKEIDNAGKNLVCKGLADQEFIFYGGHFWPLGYKPTQKGLSVAKLGSYAITKRT